jgi:hypothetical protein
MWQQENYLYCWEIRWQWVLPWKNIIDGDKLSPPVKTKVRKNNYHNLIKNDDFSSHNYLGN